MRRMPARRGNRRRILTIEGRGMARRRALTSECGDRSIRKTAPACGGPLLFTQLRFENRLQRRLDGFEQPEAQGVVVAFERDHKAHAPMLGRVGIARQGADTGKGACLEERALAASKQGGVGLKQGQQLSKAAGREAIAAADARAFLEVDGLSEAMLAEQLARDLEGFLQANRSAEALPANLQKDLVGD